MLVITIFGIALLFIDQGADFLAAVQIIVYAGAIVILFLFVIMFLGVDRKETRNQDRLKSLTPVAILVGRRGPGRAPGPGRAVALLGDGHQGRPPARSTGRARTCRSLARVSTPPTCYRSK